MESHIPSTADSVKNRASKILNTHNKIWNFSEYVKNKMLKYQLDTAIKSWKIITQSIFTIFQIFKILEACFLNWVRPELSKGPFFIYIST